MATQMIQKTLSAAWQLAASNIAGGFTLQGPKAGYRVYLGAGTPGDDSGFLTAPAEDGTIQASNVSGDGLWVKGITGNIGNTVNGMAY